MYQIYTFYYHNNTGMAASLLSDFIKKCKTLISSNESLISDGKDFYEKSKKTLATAKKKKKTAADTKS